MDFETWFLAFLAAAAAELDCHFVGDAKAAHAMFRAGLTPEQAAEDLAIVAAYAYDDWDDVQ